MENKEKDQDPAQVLENLFEIDKEDARHFLTNNVEYKKIAEFKKGSQVRQVIEVVWPAENEVEARHAVDAVLRMTKAHPMGGKPDRKAA